MKHNILPRLRTELASTDIGFQSPNLLAENTGEFYLGWELGPSNSKILEMAWQTARRFIASLLPVILRFLTNSI